MRARGLVAEVVFAGVLLASIGTPLVLRTGGQLAAGGGSSGSSSSGSSSGSSNGTSDGSSEGSSSGSSGGTTGTTSGGTTGGTRPAPVAVIPAVGTVVVATMRNLPPFVPLACLAGLLAGPDALGQGPYGRDLTSATAAACAKISIRPLRDLSGPFSDPPSRPDPNDLELKIEVDTDRHVVITPSVPSQRQNRLLLSLLAAALIVILGLVMALVVRGKKPRGYGP